MTLWEKLAADISHDDQNRRENIGKKMDRKKAVAEEHRYRRGQLLSGRDKVSESATSVKCPHNNDAPEKYPWEIREEVSAAELRKLIARKPHHQDRKEILISSQNED